jgi:hypothetical protein
MKNRVPERLSSALEGYMFFSIILIERKSTEKVNSKCLCQFQRLKFNVQCSLFHNRGTGTFSLLRSYSMETLICHPGDVLLSTGER